VSRKKETILSILVLVFFIIPLTHSFLFKYENVLIDSWLCPSFHYKITVLWYIKMLTESMQWIASLAVAAYIAKIVSETLFYVFSGCMVYKIVDLMSFIWNFKETAEVYWAMILLLSFSVYVLAFKKNKKNKLHAV